MWHLQILDTAAGLWQTVAQTTWRRDLEARVKYYTAAGLRTRIIYVGGI
jgi:hypothetical protein